MKENSHKSLQNTGRTLSNAQTLTSLCADISPNSSHFFEVINIINMFTICMYTIIIFYDISTIVN